MTEKSSLDEILEPCPNCGGDTFTTEHDTPATHYDGECHSCPVQVPCERCHAQGYFVSKAAINKTIMEEVQEIVDSTEYMHSIDSENNVRRFIHADKFKQLLAKKYGRADNE